MRKTEFDFIWEDSVFPLIHKCDNEMDTAFKSAVSLKIRELGAYREDLKRIYRDKRNWLKKEYLPYDKNAILDFHKLSAVMCRCIIGNKPFVFDLSVAEQYLKQSHNERIKGTKGSEILRKQIDNIYVNYKLAFLVAESIAFDDLVHWAQRQIAYIKNDKTIVSDPDVVIAIYEQFIDKLEQLGILADYEWTNKRHDPFFESMVSCLIKTDLLKRDFDYLLFASSMFQWQEYTKYKLLTEILTTNNITNISIVELMEGQDEDVANNQASNNLTSP